MTADHLFDISGRAAFVTGSSRGIGLALALLLPGRPRNTAHEPPEPVPSANSTPIPTAHD